MKRLNNYFNKRNIESFNCDESRAVRIEANIFGRNKKSALLKRSIRKDKSLSMKGEHYEN